MTNRDDATEMAQIFNQYSFIWVSGLLVLVIGFIMLSRKPSVRDYLAVATVAAGFVVAWVILHPRQTPLMEDAKIVQGIIGQGKPVLLEFQSPY